MLNHHARIHCTRSTAQSRSLLILAASLVYVSCLVQGLKDSGQLFVKASERFATLLRRVETTTLALSSYDETCLCQLTSFRRCCRIYNSKPTFYCLQPNESSHCPCMQLCMTHESLKQNKPSHRARFPLCITYCGGNLKETSHCARRPLSMTDCGLLQNETSDSTRIPSSMRSLNELNRRTRRVF